MFKGFLTFFDISLRNFYLLFKTLFITKTQLREHLLFFKANFCCSFPMTDVLEVPYHSIIQGFGVL